MRVLWLRAAVRWELFLLWLRWDVSAQAEVWPCEVVVDLWFGERFHTRLELSPGITLYALRQFGPLVVAPTRPSVVDPTTDYVHSHPSD